MEIFLKVIIFFSFFFLLNYFPIFISFKKDKKHFIVGTHIVIDTVFI